MKIMCQLCGYFMWLSHFRSYYYPSGVWHVAWVKGQVLFLETVGMVYLCLVHMKLYVDINWRPKYYWKYTWNFLGNHGILSVRKVGIL